MESSLEIGFLRVTEKAAIAAARTMGYGKRKYSDQVAVESMREELNRLKMRGTVVIGEGERDKAPMLYVGEPLGRGWTEGEIYPEVDIAVDPLEGTNLCATGAANAIAVLAASEKGGLLNAPDVYMDKIVVGPTAAEFVGLDKSVQENLNVIAEAFSRDVNELTIVVLDAKLAITHYRTVNTSSAYAMLEVRLETGRKNQIRAHLSEAGHPVVGDQMYDSTINPLGRLGLHAKLLGFAHPTTGQKMVFTAPLPKSFRSIFASPTA